MLSDSFLQIDHIQAVKPSVTKHTVNVGEAQQQFADSLKNAINQINVAQQQSNMKTEALAKGQIDNLHDVMIASQKASVVLQTGVEVQRKVIDAYNEIMRMQV